MVCNIGSVCVVVDTHTAHTVYNFINIAKEKYYKYY